MIEYAWALTGILGLSLIGLLIEQTGWRTPFLLLAVGMVAMNLDKPSRARPSGEVPARSHRGACRGRRAEARSVTTKLAAADNRPRQTTDPDELTPTN